MNDVSSKKKYTPLAAFFIIKMDAAGP